MQAGNKIKQKFILLQFGCSCADGLQ